MQETRSQTVSLIVPVYNAAQTLEACVDSLLKQTHSELEIILVDDGSADTSLEICNRLAEQDDRIVVLHHPNHGVSYTRNRGLEKATGTYVMFADADDTVLPDMVERYYAAAVSAQAEIVIGGIIFVKNGVETVKLPPGDRYDPNTPIDYMAQDFRGIFGYVPNKMYLRSFLTDHHLRFPEDCAVQEDMLFALDAYDCCQTVEQIQYAGYVYLMPEKEKELSFDDLIKNRIMLGKVAQKHGVDLTELKNLLNNTLYSALYHASDVETIKRYIDDSGIVCWIDYRLCQSKEKRFIIKAAINQNYYKIFRFFRFRKKVKIVLIKCPDE